MTMSKKVGKLLSNKENCFPKSSENKIPLDSSGDTDLIESSILDEKKNYFSEKRNWVLKTPKILHQNEQLVDAGNDFNSCHRSLKLGLRNSYESGSDQVKGEKNQLTTPLFTTPASKNPDSVMKKLISTLKKTPEGPYLSKSKLRNLEQWLNENAVEIVNTPPFANLSVTPVNSLKKRFSNRWKDNYKKHEESSIDSEVEDVLKAVYGDDWKQKNVQRRARTEPKKKSEKFLSPVTLTKKKEVGDFYSARRNILAGKKLNLTDESDQENNFNDSVVSGVKMINLDSSDCSVEKSKVTNLKTLLSAHKYEGSGSVKSSSLDSFRLSPVNKKKSKIMPLNKATDQRSKLRASTGKHLVAEDAFKTPKKTFLASLSASTPTSRCHPDAQYYKVNFKSKKEELVNKLFKLFNREIFYGKLAEDMNFSWNVKLRGTAGYCYNKRITKSTGEVLRVSRIEFSTKIVDRADRLRDTMIHELCHASSWVIDGVLDGHGHVWNKWASRAMKRFPELPPIKRCHNYDIVSKYVYRCTCCGYSIKRHSKSINTDRKRCGHCYGALELLINKKRKGKGEVPAFDTTRTLPTPNKFALFVKENYHTVKSAQTNAKHSEIMKTLSQQYGLLKNGSKSAKKSFN